MNRRRTDQDYAIKTAVQAFEVLDWMSAATTGEVGVTELSDELAIPKNRAFRLLATLTHLGYVEQTPDDERYRLAVKCLQLGQAYLQHHHLFSDARPILRELSQNSGETAYLGVIRGREAIYLECIASPQRVRVVSRVGSAVPVYCSALGKSLIADWSDGDVRRLLSGQMQRYTKQTITSITKLIEELKEVRQRGYAVDAEEFEDGVCCVASPVRDRDGNTVGALSMSAPSYRCGGEELHGRFAGMVRQAAEELSRRSGYQG